MKAYKRLLRDKTIDALIAILTLVLTILFVSNINIDVIPYEKGQLPPIALLNMFLVFHAYLKLHLVFAPKL